ncbi:hypothetical protein C8R45DRAFT_1096992 [Mycena sanguinolenta]|nr:hypothetical protein C8R45DRAFT_1096992 [Mycena sanguinolenta]
MPQGAWGAEAIAPTTARSGARAARWDAAVNPCAPDCVWQGWHSRCSLELARTVRTSASWGRRAVLEGREDSDPYDVNGPARRAFQLSEALIHEGDVPATDHDCCPCLVSHPHASPVLGPTPQGAVCVFVSIEEVAGGDDALFTATLLAATATTAWAKAEAIVFASSDFPGSDQSGTSITVDGSTGFANSIQFFTDGVDELYFHYPEDNCQGSASQTDSASASIEGIGLYKSVKKTAKRIYWDVVGFACFVNQLTR